MTHGLVPDRAGLQQLADSIAERMAGEAARGEVATYIPELAKVPLWRFGLAIAPLGEEVITAGDADVRFSIQSISKVFALTRALERVGSTLWARVGREPSGSAFNSIVQLELERGIPRNPFINAGAIVVADILCEHSGTDAALDEILSLTRQMAGNDSIDIDAEVAASERATGARNRALAQFMLAEGNMRSSVEEALNVYFQQCSIAMSCAELATAGRFLAAGCGGPTEPTSLSSERVRRIVALMMSCGCYDASGEVAFRIGLPCKSGVGGGVLAIVPGVAAIAVWCPGLDEKGNSLLGLRALEEVVRATGWSVFSASGAAQS